MRTAGWAASGAHADEGGQSFVEVALSLPILLLIVIGIVDIGRLYAYKVAVTNAAREAAFYGARNADAPTADALLPDGTVLRGICQRARDELGAGPSLTPCAAAPIAVQCSRGGVPCGPDTSEPRLYQTDGQGGADVSVTVTYDLSLLSGFLVGAVFSNPMRVRATAVFGGLAQ